MLGLSYTQLIVAAATLGAGVGAGLDVLCSGLSFGIFTTGTAAAGAASAYFYGKDFARLLRPSGHWKLLWPHTGRTQLQIGPLYDLQFFFVLLDRVLIFLPYVINWAHGRREPPPSNIPPATPEGYAARWPEEWRKPAIQYLKALKDRKEKDPVNKEALQGFQTVLMEVLNKISNAQEDDIFPVSEPQTRQDESSAD